MTSSNIDKSKSAQRRSSSKACRCRGWRGRGQLRTRARLAGFAAASCSAQPRCADGLTSAERIKVGWSCAWPPVRPACVQSHVERLEADIQRYQDDIKGLRDANSGQARLRGATPWPAPQQQAWHPHEALLHRLPRTAGVRQWVKLTHMDDAWRAARGCREPHTVRAPAPSIHAHCLSFFVTPQAVKLDEAAQMLVDKENLEEAVRRQHDLIEKQTEELRNLKKAMEERDASLEKAK
jgi:hypothetical protein